MPTNIDLFNYDLPESFIAQHSVEPRDHSKLMVIPRLPDSRSLEEGGRGSRTPVEQIKHLHFYDLPDLLKPGDVLVFNTSKVFKARLVDNGIEVFVLKISDGAVECLIKPGRKVKTGDSVTLFGHEFTNASEAPSGNRLLQTNMSAVEMMQFCDTHGQVPTPPYVKASHQLAGDYQNVYAKEVGSVAAPTAGFHFTEELLEKLQAKGIQIEHVVLHVGIGTFRPVQVDTLEEHTMHSEWVSLSADVAGRLNAAKQEGRRIIAVGTTTTRVLEGVANLHSDSLPLLRKEGARGRSLQEPLTPFTGDLNIFITPGYQFKIIDGLITNFHLPKSTLLVLVSALAGRENILTAYEEAKKNNYRFFSFGDGMLIQLE